MQINLAFGWSSQPLPGTYATQVQIRRFLPRLERDFNRVLEIGRASFPDERWDDSGVNRLNSSRFGHSFVAEERYLIKGFMFCSIKDGVVDLLKLAVDPQFRRQGIGTRMINDLVVRFPQLEIRKIIANVLEGDLGAHIFLSKRGFAAKGIIKEGQIWKGRDLYTFELPVSC